MRTTREYQKERYGVSLKIKRERVDEEGRLRDSDRVRAGMTRYIRWRLRDQPDVVTGTAEVGVLPVENTHLHLPRILATAPAYRGVRPVDRACIESMVDDADRWQIRVPE